VFYPGGGDLCRPGPRTERAVAHGRSYGARMPTRERVQELIDAVVTGDHAAAIARFYADDASMQENAAEPRRGLGHLVERERKVTAQVARIVSHRPDFVAIDGDRVAIHWVFEFTHQDGRVRIVDEIAMQIWHGDKIVRERFFYDSPAAAWRAPT
jgi:ketosteroid isomerase-like protein